MEDIYVFGRGKYWKYKSNEIKKKYHVVGFIDNHRNEKTDIEEGVSVYLPHEIPDKESIQILIMAGNSFFIEMVQQLIALGMPEEQIILGQNMAPYYDAGESLVHHIGGRFALCDGRLYIYIGKDGYEINDKRDYMEFTKKYREKDPFYVIVQSMPLSPLSRNYGLGFGKPIDRFYIEKFLEKNCQYIHGDVIEIENLTYTQKYGSSLNRCMALHVEDRDDCIKGNLDTGEGIFEEMADCLICTQTLQYLYHLENAAKNIYRMLKVNGTALITMPFLCQYYEGAHSWRDYWRATPQCVKEIFAEVFGENNIAVGSMGNIKAATGFLYGLCCEDMDECDLEYEDKEYPVTVWAIATRR